MSKRKKTEPDIFSPALSLGDAIRNDSNRRGQCATGRHSTDGYARFQLCRRCGVMVDTRGGAG